MEITVNGKAESTVNGSTIADLLETRGLDPERVAVELNRQVLVRASFVSTPIEDGDEIEIVQFVGGG